MFFLIICVKIFQLVKYNWSIIVTFTSAMYLRLGSQRNEYYFFNFLWKAPNFFITFEKKLQSNTIKILYFKLTQNLKLHSIIDQCYPASRPIHPSPRSTMSRDKSVRSYRLSIASLVYITAAEQMCHQLPINKWFFEDPFWNILEKMKSL